MRFAPALVALALSSLFVGCSQPQDATSVVAAAQGGQYVTVGGSVPDDARHKIWDLQAQGHKVKKVAFKPGGGWVILYDDNGWWVQNDSVTLQKLKELESSGTSSIDSVVYSPKGGSMIFYNQGSKWWGDDASHFPDALAGALNDFANKGSALIDLAFVGDAGYVILGDKFATWEGVEDPIGQKLSELGSNVPYKSVSTNPAGQGLVFLWDQAEWYGWAPNDVQKQLNDLGSQGRTLSSFSFTQQGGWVVLYN